MTKEEAREKAETKVWVYMNNGDIDSHFDIFGLKVLGKNGREKKKPTRSEKEIALIEYYTEEFLKRGNDFAEGSVDAQKESYKHTMRMFGFNM